MKSKYIRLLRPIAWITFLFPLSAGFGLGVTSKSNPFHVIFAFIAFICWMSFCFVINAIGDKEVDKFHDGRSKDMNLAHQPLVTGEITEKEALYIGMIFLFSSLLFAWLISYFFFLLMLIVDVFGYVYSMPPMRFKTKPIRDILCNALSAGAIFIAGLSIGGANMNPVMILAAFIMASIFYIPTVVTDHEFDKKVGLKTSAVFFGPKKILQAMYLLTAVVVTIGIILFLISGIELKIFALLIIIYTIVFTLVSNIKLKEERLYLHENWILVPFALISATFIIYGILKFLGLIIISS
ncbi:MAG: UbiA prenyltransferase family protein [Thermoplasmatales archaeon]|nr:UbiA prenyltransferase family protein [Thermoplasmatales archaeon]